MDWVLHCVPVLLVLVCCLRLYERLSEEDQAAAAFTEYIVEMENQGVRPALVLSSVTPAALSDTVTSRVKETELLVRGVLVDMCLVR